MNPQAGDNTSASQPAQSPSRDRRVPDEARPDRFAAWIAAYESAWRTAGTAHLAQLFTDDATYRAAPFDEPLTGIGAIARFWEDERDGPDEIFTVRSEIVAAQGDTAVARLEVVYGDPPQRTYRDLWIITLTDRGRCIHFEEWPFHPGQARTAFADPGAIGPET